MYSASTSYLESKCFFRIFAPIRGALKSYKLSLPSCLVLFLMLSRNLFSRQLVSLSLSGRAIVIVSLVTEVGVLSCNVDIVSEDSSLWVFHVQALEGVLLDSWSLKEVWM